MEILRTSNLCKTYGSGNTQVSAVDNVSLALQKGEYISVVGASGSGKSTLLHLLGGVDRPTGGSIFIEDTNIATLSEEQLAIFRRREYYANKLAGLATTNMMFAFIAGLLAVIGLSNAWSTVRGTLNARRRKFACGHCSTGHIPPHQ